MIVELHSLFCFSSLKTEGRLGNWSFPSSVQEEAIGCLEASDRRFSDTHAGEPGILGVIGSPQGLGEKGLCS